MKVTKDMASKMSFTLDFKIKVFISLFLAGKPVLNLRCVRNGSSFAL